MSYAKTFSKSDVDVLTSKVLNLATNASFNVAKANFKIAPVKLDGKNQSCQYCKYKDICNVKYEDFVEIAKKPFVSKEEEGL